MAQNNTDEITPMQQNTCTCVSSWYHDYFRCRFVPRYHFSSAGDWDQHDRGVRLGHALGNHAQIYGALQHGEYPALWRAAAFHGGQAFIRFLSEEPTRLEQQWANRTEETAHLRQTPLRRCIIAHIVLGTLLQPGQYEHAKKIYNGLYSTIQTRQFDSLWDYGIWTGGPDSAQGGGVSGSGSGNGSGSDTVVEEGEDENVPAQEGQPRNDSGVGFDDKREEEVAAARGNVESADDMDPDTGGQSDTESHDRNDGSYYTAEDNVLTDEVQSTAEFRESNLELAQNHAQAIAAIFVALVWLNHRSRQR
ncbi:uncharacterized protein PAC_11081 [Phialocephala subalpina]|uniref:Uncharacterized protein n=1 Tax=Phialocephala subalpina TaxID=576137 RepID=A0A1L7X834_9HELO|nr:uncharacterized protein PAC_11081 [Phialocephala subalpina]